MFAHARTQSDAPPGVDRVNSGPEALPEVTIVVPTRNEAGNVAALLQRLEAALTGTRAEVLFVDDSDDGTDMVIADVAQGVALPVRVLHRTPGGRAGGLGTAVLGGLAAAEGAWAVVLDGDLQHPPEVIPHMLSAARRRANDLVVASRYAGAGTRDGLAGPARRGGSWVATRVAKAVFPRRTARLTDPMSGFFAVRLAALDLRRMRPVGYKILLELVVRSPGLRIAEVAFRFADRQAGASKASIAEVLRFGRHLARLRLHIARERNDAPAASARLRSLRFLGFGLVGLSGIGVNAAALWLLHLGVFQLHYLLAAAMATQVSSAWNFVLTDRIVFRDRQHGTLAGRCLRFVAMNNVALLARLPLLALLVNAGVGVQWANVATLVLLFAARFLISDRLIYRRPRPVGASGGWPVHHLVDLVADATTLDRAGAKRIRYLPYRYDVAGMVTIGSQVRLPELEYFRAQWLDGDVDIALRVGDVGHGAPRARAAVTQFPHPAAVRYEEHLGRLGANFRIDLGSPIEVTVGPLLAHSPHVVYTNIIEALLRFVIAHRGKMLLHSACVELDGHGIMLSARTDTGKTGTILRLLREQGGRFLSDDMTIIDAQARALCFPKPLTISQHTLRAVEASDLSPAEWRRLRLQSRLHSKEGRALAIVLARFNLPIMAINALTQIVVPPPKYNVDRLVNCRIGGSTVVEDMFVLERGAPRTTELTTAETVDELMVNTADAYGFPPFEYFAPAVVLGDADYTGLLAAERSILGAAMRHVRSRRIASDAYTWADDIPRLLAERRPLIDLRDGPSAPRVPLQRDGRQAPRATEGSTADGGAS